MKLDTILLILALLLGAVYAAFVVAGMIAALPWGLIGLVVIGVAAFVFYRVVTDRLRNAEDDYYEKNIHK